MKTRLLKIGDNGPETSVAEAVSLLRRGEVVAFPTETVYGLGADALNAEAVAKIFAAKCRPADNPLIVHISNHDQLSAVVDYIPPTAQALIDRFWPGPLSIVMNKHSQVPDITTGGLTTVVVRFPQHPVAQLLISSFDGPIAAPSANLSGKVSPTTAEHVYQDLAGRIPLIIDGGPATYGLESTVVDYTTEPPVILRPGSISLEELRAVIPNITLEKPGEPIRSPGMKYRHYSPAAPVILFVGQPTETAVSLREYLADHDNQSCAVLWHTGDFSDTKLQYQLSGDPALAAPRLFAAVRELDEQHPPEILVQGYESSGLGAAIMNRLQKAATQVVEC